ncbi:MAG: hypothetical protein ACRDQ7_21005 [Haloechinothrix sp.]
MLANHKPSRIRFGWMPEAPSGKSVTPAHYVPEDAATVRYVHGFAYIARCGATCLPLYPGDHNRRIVAHPKCSECEHPGQARDRYPIPAMVTRIGERG